MPKYPSSTKLMTQGQVHSEPELSVVRKEPATGDSATYIFALGFRIQASKKGVTFSGSSTVFNEEQLRGVHKFIKKATKIHRELANGRGLISEDELDGKIRLRCARSSEEVRAWYPGSEHSVKAVTLSGAVATLRKQYRGTKVE